MTSIRLFFSILLSLFAQVAVSEPIVFKPPFTPELGWLNYGLAIMIMLILLFIIAKKIQPKLTHKSVCELIEKKYLSNKTVVYVIEYKQQRFLLADNQQALSLHPLIQERCDEPL